MTIFSSRFSLAFRIYFVALIYFLLTRVVLLVSSVGEESYGLLDLLFIFGLGWVYDTAFYIYALVPVSLYLWLVPERLWRSRLNEVFVHLLVFATLYGLGFIAVAEYLFWDEFSVRFNFISVDYLVYRREVTDNINESYPLPLLLSVIFVVTLFSYAWVQPVVRRVISVREKWRRRAVLAMANILLAVTAAWGLGQEPRSLQHSTYVRELGSNGPYQFFAAFRNNQLNYRAFYATLEDVTASHLLRAAVAEKNSRFLGPEEGYDIKRKIEHDGDPRRYNIMLVMVESLSAEYMGAFGNSQRLTPNLDRLAEESLLFTRMYATGTRTTRGLEAVTLSIPPTPGRSIVKRVGRESNLWSLGNVLREEGYVTTFLYGGHGYFDNMNAFFSGNGYDIIDKPMVPDEAIGFSNAWGMADEYLYQQAIEAADKAHAGGQPFYFHIMTTSNHRPYTYPDGRIDIPSGTGREGAVKYTDWAIGDFLEKARRHPWFDDTLFVFIADHTAGSAGKVDLPVNRYHIPLIIYAPKIMAPRRVDRIVSQIDVGPTLLGLLNVSYTSAFFGKDMLTPDGGEGRALIGNYQHLGYYTQGRISILSPQREVRQYLMPENENPQQVTPAPDDPHLMTAQAFYQGADTVYNDKLNAWKP